MSSLSKVGRSAAACKNDRVSLCSFTFSDGRRCRTPRAAKHLHFCFYHAQKEARARAAETLGKDLAYFFSGDYLSACDLSTALSRLIPAVVRGDVKPRTARTVAYLAQTLLQAIHISQHEYINAFETDDWRKSIRNSVNSNHDYLFPPKPKPQQPQSQSQQPGPSSRAPMPPTSAEFVQHVVAGLPRSLRSDPVGQTGTSSPQLASCSPSNPPQPDTVAHPFRGEAFPSASPPPQPVVIPNPVALLANGGEGPASSTTPAAQQPSQEVPEQPRLSAAAPSASRQEPRPAAAPQTGPSGLPVLAPLPPPKLEAPLGSSSH